MAPAGSSFDRRACRLNSPVHGRFQPGNCEIGGRSLSPARIRRVLVMKQALAIAILASLVLAGCGSKDTAADATAADDAPTVAATMPTTVADPAETQRLRSFEGCDSNGDG